MVDKTADGGAHWLFNGAHNKDGYGIFRVDCNGIGLQYAHRVSFALEKGTIEAGVEILHAIDCPYRNCVRPDCLSAGVHAENMAQRWEREHAWRYGVDAKRLFL